MSLRALLAGAGGGGGRKLHATGFVSTSTLTSGTTQTENAKYFDVTIPALPDPNKAEIQFVGGAANNGAYYGPSYFVGTGGQETYIVLYRILNATTVRLSYSGDLGNNVNMLRGRYWVYDLS